MGDEDDEEEEEGNCPLANISSVSNNSQMRFI